MNCSQIRDRLPLLCYGDLAPAEAARVEAHLQGCAACRAERAALAGVRQLLDQVPTPEPTLDLPALYRQLDERRGRQLTRWRRVAVSLAALAALLLLAVGLALEVRLENHQISVRWGSPPSMPPAVAPLLAGPSLAPLEARLADDAEQLQILRELVYALKRDADSRDTLRQQDLIRLQLRLAVLQRQMDQRWTETEQNVSALYTLSRKGNVP